MAGRRVRPHSVAHPSPELSVPIVKPPSRAAKSRVAESDDGNRKSTSTREWRGCSRIGRRRHLLQNLDMIPHCRDKKPVGDRLGENENVASRTPSASLSTSRWCTFSTETVHPIATDARQRVASRQAGARCMHSERPGGRRSDQRGARLPRAKR